MRVSVSLNDHGSAVGEGGDDARRAVRRPRVVGVGAGYLESEAEAMGLPLPATPGGPPVPVGGAGERRTLRLVAEQADACNLFDVPELVAQRRAAVCAALGALGLDHVIVLAAGPWTPERVEVVAAAAV